MKKIVIMMITFALAACTSHYVPPPQKPLTYTGQTYRLNVGNITVFDDYDSTDQNTSYVLGKEMHKWSQARLSAQGADKRMEVRITEAGITKKALPKQKSGVEGFFTKEQTEELSGRLSVDMKLYSPEKTLPVAFAQASVELSRTVREDASLEERKAVHRQIVSEIMQEIDKLLEEKLRTYFSQYLM